MIAKRTNNEDFNVPGMEVLFSIGWFIAEKEHRRIETIDEMIEYLKELFQREVLVVEGDGKTPGRERIGLYFENMAYGSDTVSIEEFFGFLGW